MLLKKHWIDLIRREHWFSIECVPYPVGEEFPEFLKGAYFVPEFRISQHERCVSLYLGVYETHSHSRLQLEKDYYQLEVFQNVPALPASLHV